MNHYLHRFTALISRPVIFLAIIASIFALTAATDASTVFAPRVSGGGSKSDLSSSSKSAAAPEAANDQTAPDSDVTQPALITTPSVSITAPNGTTFTSTSGPVPTGTITVPKPPIPTPSPVYPPNPNPEPTDPPYRPPGCGVCGAYPHPETKSPSMMCPMYCLE